MPALQHCRGGNEMKVRNQSLLLTFNRQGVSKLFCQGPDSKHFRL